MAKQNIIPPQTNPMLAAYYDVNGTQIDALVKDRTFQAAFKALDVDAAAKAFNSFTEKITTYNNIHRRERRLWSLKLGKGGIPSDLESQFVQTIPEMRKNYKEAFTEIDKVLNTLSQAKFDKVVEKHLTPLMANLGNDKHPLTQAVTDYFRKVGCAPEMMSEFRRNFEVTQYNFMSITGGTLSGLRNLTSEGVKAQVAIMDYTEKEGFSYLRGNCGPPGWAVAVAKILASIGISISAWVVVIIVAALFITLLLVCNNSSPGTWLRQQCEKVKAKFDIFNF